MRVGSRTKEGGSSLEPRRGLGVSFVLRFVRDALAAERVLAASSALVLLTAAAGLALRSPEDPSVRAHFGSAELGPGAPTDGAPLDRLSAKGSSAPSARSANLAEREGAPVGPTRPGRPGDRLGRGVFENKVVVGWEGLGDSAGSATKGVGVTTPTASESEQRKAIQVIAEHINARGGIGGKPIEVLFHFVDVTAGTHDSRGAESCAFFTEDHEVFAVLMLANHSHTFTRCMASRKTPVIDVSSTVLPHDQKDLDEHAPHLYLPIRVNLSRLDIYIDALAEQGFFAGDVKVGLLRYDWTTHKRVRDRVIVPALARHGVKLTDEFAFTMVQSVSDLSRAGSQAASAVLRFRSKGVNRLLFLPTAWVVPTVWPPAAESQGYRARYGINSWEGPDFLANNAPPEQLREAVGVGWQPATDLGPTRSIEVLRKGAHWSHCAVAGRKAGYPEEFATACTPFLFLQEAVARGSLTTDGLRSGADKLGDAPYSNSNMGTFFGPGRYDGAAVGRNIAFDPGCGCFEYVGPAYKIP